MEVLKYIQDNKNIIVLKQDSDTYIEISFFGADFFFVLHNYQENNEFVIDSHNELYIYFKEVFDGIKEYDKNFNKILDNNKFVWISEDYGDYQNAHRLTIIQEEEKYILKFYNNPNKQFRSRSICPICFCLDGSRYQEISNLFAISFNEFVSSNKYIKKLC